MANGNQTLTPPRVIQRAGGRALASEPSFPNEFLPRTDNIASLTGRQTLAQLEAQVKATPSLPDRDKPESLTVFRKAGRLITTPLSVSADLYRSLSLRTAPRTWDIITQKKEVSFIDVLLEKGVSEKTARWGGLAMDLVLDPLNFTGIGMLTKAGRVAQRSLTGSKKLAETFGKIVKPIDFVEDATSLNTTFLKGVGIKDGSKFAQEAAEVMAMGGNIEYGTSVLQQVSRGQRTLLSLNVPFTSMKGVSILPKSVSMMAFAIPNAARKAFVGAAKRIKVPGDSTKTLADVMAAAFRRGTGDPVLDRVSLAFRGLIRTREGKIMTRALEKAKEARLRIDAVDWDKVTNIFEKEIKAADLMKGRITEDVLKRAGADASIAGNKDIQEVLEALRVAMVETYKSEKMNKIPLTALMDDTTNYMLHLATPELRQALRRSSLWEKTNGRLFSGNHGSLIMRNKSLRGKSAAQVNELGAKGKLPFLPGVVIKKAFETDPLAVAFTRMHRTVRSVTGVQYLNMFSEAAVQRGLALKIPAKLKGAARAKFIRDAGKKGFTEVSASTFLKDNFLYSSKSVVRELDRNFSQFSKIESVNDFVRYYDASFNFLKGITLAPFPTYHLRNMVDNLWRNYIAGVNPVSYYYARIGLRHFGKDGQAALQKTFKTARGETWTLEEIVNAAQNMGIIGQNSRDAEFLLRDPQRFLNDLKSGNASKWKNLVNPRAAENTIIRGGFDVGKHYVENPTRLAHFIDRIIKGDTVLDASMSVKKFHFEYEDLTEFERNVMRRVVFFYAFLRNNLPFQIEQVLTKPGKIGSLFILERSKIIPDLLKQNDETLKTKFMQDWVREGAPFFIGRDPKDENKVRYLMLDGYISTFDLQRLADPGDYFVNILSPFLREPFSQAANFDFFFKEPIVSMPGYKDSMAIKQDFIGMSVPKRVVHLARNIRMVNEIDQMMKRISRADEPIDATIGIVERFFFGGAAVSIQEPRARRDYAFRLKDIAETGRREFLRAIRRGEHEEAVKIQKITMARLARGW